TYLQGPNRDDRPDHRWMETAAEVNDRTDVHATQLYRPSPRRNAGVQPTCAMEFLAASSRDVAAHLDARDAFSQGYSLTLVCPQRRFRVALLGFGHIIRLMLSRGRR